MASSSDADKTVYEDETIRVVKKQIGPPSTELKANAGNDFSTNITDKTIIILDGSKSTGNITKSIWSQLNDDKKVPDVKILDDSKLITSFVAEQEGTYNFILGVGDNEGNASTDDIAITVKKGIAPPPNGDKDPGLPTSDKYIEQYEKGGNKNPRTWKVVRMVKNPAWSKIVDDKNINIAVEFTSAKNAQQYIDHFIYLQDHKPPTHECPSGQHWDDSVGRCIENPPQPAGDKYDKHGVTKIFDDFPFKADQNWFSIGDNWVNDKRLRLAGTIKQIAPGVFQGTPTSGMNPPSLRINILTTDPNADDAAVQGKQAQDWQVMMARKDSDGVWRGGWMISDRDFRNAEITEYYKITKDGKDQDTHYCRGGHHGHGDYSTECASLCIKQQLQCDLIMPRAAKEETHFNSPKQYAWKELPALFDLKSELNGSMENKLIGQKTVFYNVMNAAKDKVDEVIMETWIDTGSLNLDKPDFNKQNWRLWAKSVDKGDWPKAEDQGYVKGCNAVDAQMLITNGGPTATVRLDESTKIFYTLSIREIDPDKRLLVTI